MVRTILYSLWLPVLVVVVSAFRFGFNTPLEGPGFMGTIMLGSGGWSSLSSLEGPGFMGTIMFLMSFVTLFALAWPAAIPLTLAVRLLHRRSQVLAYVCALILGAGSVLAVIVGGLFGPVGVVVYTLIAALPAWILLGILAKFQRGGMGNQPSRA